MLMQHIPDYSLIILCFLTASIVIWTFFFFVFVYLYIIFKLFLNKYIFFLSELYIRFSFNATMVQTMNN